jgi:hypothetical protein
VKGVITVRADEIELLDYVGEGRQVVHICKPPSGLLEFTTTTTSEPIYWWPNDEVKVIRP